MRDTILLLIGTSILSYIITSFALWEIDPLKWEASGRIGFMCLTVMFYTLVKMAVNKEINETPT